MEWQIFRAKGIFEHKNNVREHYYCVKELFDLYQSKEQLEALAKRPDIDTVCAFDYQRLKSYALDKEGLKYTDYHPELNNIKVP